MAASKKDFRDEAKERIKTNYQRGKVYAQGVNWTGFSRKTYDHDLNIVSYGQALEEIIEELKWGEKFQE